MKKKLKITYNSPVVLVFVTICFAATILNYVAGGIINQLIFMTYRAPLNSPMTYIRLLCHVFGHADFAHFIGNAVPLTFILVAILFIGQEVAQGLMIMDNVSNMAHIVGGLVGAALGFKLNKE